MTRGNDLLPRAFCPKSNSSKPVFHPPDTALCTIQDELVAADTLHSHRVLYPAFIAFTVGILPFNAKRHTTSGAALRACSRSQCVFVNFLLEPRRVVKYASNLLVRAVPIVVNHITGYRRPIRAGTMLLYPKTPENRALFMVRQVLQQRELVAHCFSLLIPRLPLQVRAYGFMYMPKSDAVCFYARRLNFIPQNKRPAIPADRSSHPSHIKFFHVIQPQAG